MLVTLGVGGVPARFGIVADDEGRVDEHSALLTIFEMFWH